jgi:WD40 repeat protein
MFANSLSFEADLNRLVAGCGDRNVRVWDLET